MKQLAKIIVWIMAAPVFIFLFVTCFPLGILFLQIETDLLDGVPNWVVNLAAVGGELAWILFVIAPTAYKLLTGGS